MYIFKMRKTMKEEKKKKKYKKPSDIFFLID